ncbi:uncharacterized protein BJ171DRAFT_422746 [Polychytrium aggregatum]|uniref:uncharacterized protein n=1 Tax=Polychytrium aggregatum TaxID=110093 RepID=UPI0022FE3A5A|nr:uncharacterized protein BJ171DRAFT_422746 [Polychytrium aggregatum]KAI9205769.1 hypothetical protein BJ171DRAFT_422746 [Polychytrium aggregatum]
MEFILEAADHYVFNQAYAQLNGIKFLEPYIQIHHPAREFFTLFIITLIGGYILYFAFASIDYYFFFDKSVKNDPKYLKNQISKEIFMATWSIPIMVGLTVPWWWLEIHGYSRIYHNVDDYGVGYMVFSILAFLFFTDMLIYFIHRAEHHPSVYWWLHKPHHLWKVSTPFASHAFHPLDGYAQSVPYHLFVFCFPMHSTLYLVMFALVNFWTISIHDRIYLTKASFFNGAAHHTVHHSDFNYNYGQYFTFW